MAFEKIYPGWNLTRNRQQDRKTTVQYQGILTGILVVALMGTWGYIIWDKNNVKETIQQKETLIASTTNQRDELQKELEDATMRYDLLKTAHARKDSIITAKDRDIAEKKGRIQALLAKATLRRKN